MANLVQIVWCFVIIMNVHRWYYEVDDAKICVMHNRKSIISNDIDSNSFDNNSDKPYVFN